MDILEHPALKDVIILQTVLDELRHRSLPLYNRVRALTGDPKRHFYVYSNEYARYVAYLLCCRGLLVAECKTSNIGKLMLKS